MTPVRKRLIVTADDFGLSPAANRNILALAEQGRLDRVSVMVRGKISPEEIRRLLATGVALDAHLDIPALVTPKKGAVGRTMFFLLQYISGKLSTRRISSDWAEQIEIFKKKFNRYPDGINSHQHIHFFPPYFKISIALAQKFNIPFLRFGKESILVKKGLVSLALRILSLRNRALFRKGNLDSADFLMSLDWIKNPQDFLRHLVPGTTEVICHPEREEELEIVKKHF
jgi:predicted glycoside hydrolase/deacetylase ChbG (UPF0249 family)